MAWYLLQGRPTFQYNFEAHARTTVAASEALSPGVHTLGLRLDRAEGPGAAADVSLTLDGAEVASGRIDRTIDDRFSLDESFDVGSDTGTPVSDVYQTPNHFTGGLREFDLRLR